MGRETILPAQKRFATFLALAAAAWFDRLTMTQHSKPSHPELVEGRQEPFATPGAHPVRRRDHVLPFLAGEQPKVATKRFN
jgi:hypothetical protein